MKNIKLGYIIMLFAVSLVIISILLHFVFGMLFSVVLLIFHIMISMIFTITRWDWLHKFCHWYLGWHTPDDCIEHHGLFITKSHCKYCKKEIMQDSQGNWY